MRFCVWFIWDLGGSSSKSKKQSTTKDLPAQDFNLTKTLTKALLHILCADPLTSWKKKKQKNYESSSLGSIGNSLIFPESVRHWFSSGSFPEERHAPRGLKMESAYKDMHACVCVFKWMWAQMCTCMLMCIETQSCLATLDCSSLYLLVQGLILNTYLTDSGQPPGQLARTMPISISLVLVL